MTVRWNKIFKTIKIGPFLKEILTIYLEILTDHSQLRIMATRKIDLDLDLVNWEESWKYNVFWNIQELQDANLRKFKIRAFGDLSGGPPNLQRTRFEFHPIIILFHQNWLLKNQWHKMEKTLKQNNTFQKL